MKRYYNIGGKQIAIDGDNLEYIDRLFGFELFESTPSESTPLITLSNRATSFCTDNLIYKITIQTVIYSFYHTEINEYGMTLQNEKEKEVSTTLYGNIITKTFHVGGDMQPIFLRFALWMAYGLSMITSKRVAIHASAIKYKDGAVIFLGESGTGKSTHTRLWREIFDGAELLNDDSPILGVDNGVCYAYGSPWSGKAPCFKQDRVKVTAIVRLSQAPHNKIRQLSTLEAIGSLLPSCPPAFGRDDILCGFICDILSSIISTVPIYHLECLPNHDAAKLSFQACYNDLLLAR